MFSEKKVKKFAGQIMKEIALSQSQTGQSDPCDFYDRTVDMFCEFQKDIKTTNISLALELNGTIELELWLITLLHLISLMDGTELIWSHCRDMVRE